MFPKEFVIEDGIDYYRKKPLHKQPLFWTTIAGAVISLVCQEALGPIPEVGQTGSGPAKDHHPFGGKYSQLCPLLYSDLLGFEYFGLACVEPLGWCGDCRGGHRFRSPGLPVGSGQWFLYPHRAPV